MIETKENKGENTVYEIGYLVLPSIPEDSLSGVVSSIQEVVKGAGGVEVDGESPIKKNLAYEMSKTVGSSKYVVKEAYVGWIKFETTPEAIGEVKLALEKIEELLRFIIVKAPRETFFTFAKSGDESLDEESSEDASSEDQDDQVDDAEDAVDEEDLAVEDEDVAVVVGDELDSSSEAPVVE